MDIHESGLPSSGSSDVYSGFSLSVPWTCAASVAVSSQLSGRRTLKEGLSSLLAIQSHTFRCPELEMLIVTVRVMANATICLDWAEWRLRIDIISILLELAEHALIRSIRVLSVHFVCRRLPS